MSQKKPNDHKILLFYPTWELKLQTSRSTSPYSWKRKITKLKGIERSQVLRQRWRSFLSQKVWQEIGNSSLVPLLLHLLPKPQNFKVELCKTPLTTCIFRYTLSFITLNGHYLRRHTQVRQIKNEECFFNSKIDCSCVTFLPDLQITPFAFYILRHIFY